jgi:hypothetical protein
MAWHIRICGQQLNRACPKYKSHSSYHSLCLQGNALELELEWHSEQMAAVSSSAFAIASSTAGMRRTQCQVLTCAHPRDASAYAACPAILEVAVLAHNCCWIAYTF